MLRGYITYYSCNSSITVTVDIVIYHRFSLYRYPSYEKCFCVCKDT